MCPRPWRAFHSTPRQEISLKYQLIWTVGGNGLNFCFAFNGSLVWDCAWFLSCFALPSCYIYYISLTFNVGYSAIHCFPHHKNFLMQNCISSPKWTFFWHHLQLINSLIVSPAQWIYAVLCSAYSPWFYHLSYRADSLWLNISYIECFYSTQGHISLKICHYFLENVSKCSLPLLLVSLVVTLSLKSLMQAHHFMPECLLSEKVALVLGNISKLAQMFLNS